MESPRLNLFSPEICADPYPTYALCREHFPVCQVDPGGLWLITRYDDVQFALKRSDIFSSAGFREMLGPEWLADDFKRDLSILSQDPPTHTKNRTLVNRAFISRVIDNLVPFMEEVAGELLDKIGRSASADFSAQFAYPYAGKIISKITGIDQYQDVDALRRWSEVTEVISSIRPSDEQVKIVENALGMQNAYFDAVILSCRNNPRDDLINLIINAEIDGERQSDETLRNMMNLLIGAGFTTTAHALSNTLLYLCEHQELMAQLRSTPTLIPAFIEEMLRYNGPSHRVLRITTTAVTLSGVQIPQGATVLIALASANRDPARFEAPDTFNMNRNNIRDHVAFGWGPHVCIGAALARQEIRIALEALLRTYASITCTSSNLTWIDSLTTSGVKELPIILR